MSGKGGVGGLEPMASPRFPAPGPGLCPVMSLVSSCWRLSGRRRLPASCQPCPWPCPLLCSQGWVIEEVFRSEPLKRPACFPACCADLPDGAACSVLGLRGEGWGALGPGCRGPACHSPPPRPRKPCLFFFFCFWKWNLGGSRDGGKGRCVSWVTCVEPCRLRAGAPFSGSSCESQPGTRAPLGPARLGPARLRPVAQEADLTQGIRCLYT